MSENQTGNNTPLIIGIIAILVLMLCCCLAVVGLALGGLVSVPWTAVSNSRVEATEKIEKNFDISTPTSLAVDINVGDVIIRVGEGDQVSITAVKRAWGRDQQQAQDYLDDVKIKIEQADESEIRIKDDVPRRLRNVGRTPSIDLEISVPRNTNLDLKINVGEVKVTGLRGDFNIQSNVGDITLRDVQIEDDSQIRNNVGDIELRLPANSVFTFSAQTDVGEIEIDFDVQNERSDKKVVGGRIEGEIGASPTSHVELETNTGNIEIRK